MPVVCCMLENIYIAGLQITVRHRTMSNQIWKMSEQSQILIGPRVRQNIIYCLIKKTFCFMILRETSLPSKESPIFFRQFCSSIDWIKRISILTIYNMCAALNRRHQWKLALYLYCILNRVWIRELMNPYQIIINSWGKHKGKS